MPSYTALRTIDKSRPDGGLITRIETSIANDMATKWPEQYEIVSPTKIQVTPHKKTESKPCVGCK